MVTLRLLKSYRGYGPGKTIQATPQLAEYLAANGIAVREPQVTLLEPDKAERAVAPQAAAAAIETR